jgi:hypothetical protein
MIENATNLTAQEGMSIVYIKLKTFFSDPSWVGNVLLAFLIGVTIVTYYLSARARKRSDFYNRLPQICDELLKSGKVKLDYDIKGLKYIHPNHPEWDGFISVVKRQMKRRRYKARGLYKKAEIAVNNYNAFIKRLKTKIASFLANGFKKGQQNIIIWDGSGERPSGDYVDLQKISYGFRRGMSLSEKREDGRYVLSAVLGPVPETCERAMSISGSSITIAKTTSESKKDWLRDFIESMANDDEINELNKKCAKAKNDVKRALEMYNNKLAKVIQDLRFCRY